MCKVKKYHGTSNTRIDKCMRPLIRFLRQLNKDYNLNLNIIACCCGHGKYPMTIVEKSKGMRAFEILSGNDIFRKRKFYKRDNQGYYYIPEVVKK